MERDDQNDGAASRLSADLGRGSSQSGIRLYNERLVLSLIRRHGSLPKAEIARLTGLSAQTASVIVTQLEADGLLVKQDRQRGRVGQPSVPFALNPRGALAVGLKIGRRSSDLVLVDFGGAVRHRIHTTHAYPLPRELMRFVRDGIAEIGGTLSPAEAARVAGFGIATPFELWSWESEVGAPASAMQAWRTFETEREIAAVSPWPVRICNDGTAACAAECLFGRSDGLHDFLYVFIGSFVGGGVVLNGSVVQGRSGNAGAIGSMPIARLDAGGRLAADQLIRRASLYVLEGRLADAGIDPSLLWASTDEWPNFGAPFDDWLATASDGIAVLAAAACSIIEFEAIVIDGAFPVEIRKRVVEATKSALTRIDWQGLSPVEIKEGTIGAQARAVGGAALPILANFARDREVLFKDASSEVGH